MLNIWRAQTNKPIIESHIESHVRGRKNRRRRRRSVSRYIKLKRNKFERRKFKGRAVSREISHFPAVSHLPHVHLSILHVLI